MGKEVEDMGKAQATFREELDSVEMRTTDVEMSVQGAHFAIAPMQEDIWELNNVMANVNNELERMQQEDVAWCHSRILALEKPNNPANRSL
jgi:hypothetical protein